MMRDARFGQKTRLTRTTEFLGTSQKKQQNKSAQTKKEEKAKAKSGKKKKTQTKKNLFP